MALTLSTALATAKNTLHGGDAIIWLIDLVRTGSTSLRIAKWPDNITYAGNTYSRGFFKMDDVSEVVGSLTRVRVTLSNVLRLVQGYLEAGEIIDQRATLYILPESLIGTSTGARSFAYQVEDAACSDVAVSFSLTLWPLMSIVFPRDRFIRRRCRHVFKDSLCQYSGPLTTCDKSYDDGAGCLGRDNRVNYGGFPDLLNGDTAIPL